LYLDQLLAKRQPADSALLRQRLYALLQSRSEDDWMLAGNFFYRLKATAVMDSLKAAERLAFPQGKLVRNEAVQQVFDQKDPVQKEALYKAWLARFAPERLGGDRIMYDYARNAVGNAYAEADSVQKALHYANSIETPFWRGEGFASTARILRQKGHLAEAGTLYRNAVQVAAHYRQLPNPDNAAQFAAAGYASYCAAYASILHDMGANDSALVYAGKAYQQKPTAPVTELYATVLAATGKDQQALDVLAGLVKQGMAGAKAEALLKDLYLKTGGTPDTYGRYLGALHDSMSRIVRDKAAAKMINRPAPAFTLKNLEGKTVSLKSLKGKVVVLDFWATWCGPCKRSFPAMQLAVEKYQKDAGVQFLFIDTWERVPDARPLVSSFLQENRYTFNVLLDNGDKKAVEDFQVSAIPAKFVLDARGNIRFMLTGFDGSNESAVSELSAMIELARKG
jgi:thiol-disulfide isomerase/thioredoxin